MIKYIYLIEVWKEGVNISSVSILGFDLFVDVVLL